MDVHALTVELGWSAVVVGIISTYVQLHRITMRGIEGVSLATWILFVYMGCFWIMYGATAHSWQVILGSLIVLPIQLSLLFRLKPWENMLVVSQAFAFFALCCVLPTILWGWPGGVYGTGVAMTINRAPQLLELFRHPDASGVSAGSWVLAVIGSLMWISYYMGAHLWAALIATGFAGAANLSIALLAGWRHQQSRQQTTAYAIADS